MLFQNGAYFLLQGAINNIEVRTFTTKHCHKLFDLPYMWNVYTVLS